MATLNKGAPVDVKFINELASQLDKLVAVANASPYQQTSINNTLFDTSGMRIMRTSETRIHTETKSLPTVTYAAGSTVNFSVALTNFASAPTATVTPVVLNTTSEKVALFAVITSITASAVNGYLYFQTSVPSGVTVGVSVTAIGIPSNSPGTAGTNSQANMFYTAPQMRTN